MSVDNEPCLGAVSHAPLPLFTERHHVFPMYLCGLLNVPRIEILRPLCGNCHTRVHHVIHHLVNTGQYGHRLSPGEMALVEDVWSWWQRELAG